MIVLAEIVDGDEVIIQDEWGNKARGQAHLARDHRTLYLLAFGTHIDFAKRTSGGWQRANHIKVMAHQEALIR